MKKLLLIAAYMLFAVGASTAQPVSNSLWQNQRGSTLEIYAVAADGTFQGEFINRAPGYRCQNVGYPAAGRIVNGRIEFSVTFWKLFGPSCDTVTTWRGAVSGRVMQTVWLLVYQDSSGRPHTLRGADRFIKTR